MLRSFRDVSPFTSSYEYTARQPDQPRARLSRQRAHARFAEKSDAPIGTRSRLSPALCALSVWSKSVCRSVLYAFAFCVFSAASTDAAESVKAAPHTLSVGGHGAGASGTHSRRSRQLFGRQFHRRPGCPRRQSRYDAKNGCHRQARLGLETYPGELKLMGEEPRFVYVKSCFLSHVVWYYSRVHTKYQ
jgi:hypothetical protein